jgi:uncharacterized protein (TIGR02217 family)
MAFHDVVFPMNLALGAKGGPDWQTQVVRLASGAEIRNSTWSRSRRRWEVGSALTDLADLQTLVAFFEARSGALHGFRFRDPLDHQSCGPGDEVQFQDQALGQGDGSTTQFQLVKTRDQVSRIIRTPVVDTVSIGLDGAIIENGWSVHSYTGLVSFEAPPPLGAVITAGFEFDVPVRFESDQIETVIEAFGAGRIAPLGLIELWVDAS